MTLKLNFDADRNLAKTDWIEYFNDFVKPTDYDTNAGA
jgi:hypothetical protein